MSANRGSDSFSWDDEDRITSATVGGTTWTYAYRGDGLRDSATTGATTRTFTWDVNAGLPVILDDGAQYIYGAGLIAQVSGANAYYYLADGLGSTMATTDASGAIANSYTYDVYGVNHRRLCLPGTLHHSAEESTDRPQCRRADGAPTESVIANQQSAISTVGRETPTLLGVSSPQCPRNRRDGRQAAHPTPTSSPPPSSACLTSSARACRTPRSPSASASAQTA